MRRMVPGAPHGHHASVALQWVIAETGTPAALRLPEEEDALHAPDFLLIEVANMLWAKARRRIFPRTAADAAYEAIAKTPLALTPLAELIAPRRGRSRSRST